jgi:hypothetical protein
MADLERVVWWAKPEREHPPTPERVDPVATWDYIGSFNKCDGGLWTSPEGSAFGWEDWCRGEGMDGWLGTRYVLKVAGAPRILRIDSAADLEAAWSRFGRTADMEAAAARLGLSDTQREIVARYGPQEPQRDLDFGAMTADYDALWLTDRGHFETRMGLGLNTYAWDCETVLWFRWCFSDVRVDETVPADG